MNAHIYAYLKNQSQPVMRAACGLNERAQQRNAVISAVQAFPAHQRKFIADFVWSQLGYGGGI